LQRKNRKGTGGTGRSKEQGVREVIEKQGLRIFRHSGLDPESRGGEEALVASPLRPPLDPGVRRDDDLIVLFRHAGHYPISWGEKS